jgi:thiamine-monophosphate kinase
MELDFVAWLQDRLPDDARLRVGLGDDAAILRLGRDADCVVTTDLLADGVHFRLDEAGAARVGRKALAVNLSDLAAMAARPHSAVVSLLLPRARAQRVAVDLIEGMLPLAQQFDLAIAGGDTNCWDGPLVVNVTAIGRLTERGPWLRSGAVPGDSVIVTGHLGGSILGHHYDFQPRVQEALLLRSRYGIDAAMDISDGLLLDLSRICQASGCGALLQLERIPLSGDAGKLARQEPPEGTALRHALVDGEDFELLLAVPPGEDQRLLDEHPLPVPLTRIGQFVPDRGLWRQLDDGRREPLIAEGYQHGRKR